MSGFFSVLWRYRLFIVQLVRIQLLLRYRRTALGFVWTLVSPVMTMAVSAFVFSHLLRFPMQQFVVYVFSGMLPWLLLSNSVTIGGATILNNENLLRKVALPIHAFPIAGAIGVLVDNMFALVALFAIALVMGAPITSALLVLPLSYLVVFLFVAACSLFFAVVFVFFRDMQHITGVALQALMYATPIFYPLEALPEHVRPWFQLNPMYYLIRLFREPIHEGRVPELKTWIGCLLIAGVMAVIAGVFYSVLRKRIMFRL
ncbi:MAG: ABC transporter permease [Planctomycetes bacterium]|nr:ABC transporter permease [Planctomycetota bacterium]